MKQNITFCSFCDAFRDMNRDNNFSYDGKRALFDYLESYEEDTDEEIELDIIALCCEYNEYEDLNEYLNTYYTTEEINEFIGEITGNKEERSLNEDEETEFKAFMENEISENTTLIKLGDDLNDGFIIRSY